MGRLSWARPGVAQWWRDVRPRSREALSGDAVAGISGAISGVPDGMAASVLAGVNPVHGLYASFAGRVAGGMSSSTRLMVVTTTSAAALAAGSALEGVPADERPDALFAIAVVAGVAMVVAGMLRLGRYTRFVSHSVMTGFLTGVAVNIVLSQFDELTGVPAEGPNALAKAIDVITAPAELDGWTMATAALAIVTVLLLSRSRLAQYASIFALVVPTVIAALADADVLLVRDVGDIPQGLPRPSLPDIGTLSVGVVTGALAVAAIVLVQGVGVAESTPNLDGSRSTVDRDFVAQGVANVAAGAFQGMPVGGSVGQTALNARVGARDRWAGIFSGVWIVAIIALLGGVVEQVAMATLAAVLVLAAIGSIRVRQLETVWRSGVASQIALVTTFVCTLFLPIPAAVGIGVALSLLLQLNRDLMDLRIVRLVRLEDGRLEEQPAPSTLPDRSVCVLDAYGSLLYAGARTLQAKLPDPTGADRPVVVLRLRGRVSLGATVVVVLCDYAERLGAVGGRLMLAGVDPAAASVLHQAGGRRFRQSVDVFEATSIIGESLAAACQEGEAWLSRSESS